MWTSSPPHLEQSKTLISASTATVSVVPTPFVGCTSPLALDPASLAKLQQNASLANPGSSSSSPHMMVTSPKALRMSRMSFSFDIPARDFIGQDCTDSPSSPTSDKELMQKSSQFTHPNSPSSTPQTSSKSKKNMLNSWRTSLKSKGRSSSGRFATSAIPPISSCVISEGVMSYDSESPKSPGYTTDEDVQNSRNDNSQNFEWNMNLGRRWSESVTSNPKLVLA